MIVNGKETSLPPVVIFAGGRGTRLGVDELSLPKPLVRIGPFPIIIHIIASYVMEGFTDFIVCAGYKSLDVKHYFNSLDLVLGNTRFELTPHGLNKSINHSGFIELGIAEKSFSVEIVDTGLETLTSGRLAAVRDLISTDYFMCTYGDGLTSQEIRAVMDFHIQADAIATLTAFNPPSRFGELTIGSGGIVKHFEEKPLSQSFVNGGYFVFSKKIFDHLNTTLSLEEGLLKPLSTQGLLRAYQSSARWQMMDTPREVSILNNLYHSGEAFWLNK